MKKRYCYTCGTIVKQTRRIYAYDENTGKPLIEIISQCPKAKFFTLKQHPLTLSEASSNYLCGIV